MAQAIKIGGIDNNATLGRWVTTGTVATETITIENPFNSTNIIVDTNVINTANEVVPIIKMNVTTNNIVLYFDKLDSGVQIKTIKCKVFMDR